MTPKKLLMRAPHGQAGLTMVELLVALAISLVLVLATTYVYLATRQSDRALERSSDAQETGVYVLQLLGREIANAGFYPASRPPMVVHVSQTGMIDTYPPLQADPRMATDWMNTAAGWPPTAFMTGIFGCDSALFDTASSTCGTVTAGTGDTIVINSFTSDSMANVVGSRFDCTGANVAGTGTSLGDDVSNGVRKLNTGGNPPLTPHTGLNENLPPQLPLFVSNRYTMRPVKIALDQSDISSFSLSCSGNGRSPHGKTDTAAYQTIVSGLSDLRFAYGVYMNDQSLAPARFYTATEVGALAPIVVNGQSLNGWQRVTAVRVCVLTQTLGGGTRLADKAGAARTYLDCSDTPKNQPTGSTITRYTQVFGLRNALKQTF